MVDFVYSYAICHMQSVVMVSVVRLSVVMLNAIILSVIMLYHYAVPSC
jgi:hypothetical protein